MSVIDVHSEQETPHGWSYQVRIERPGGRESTHEITLAWVDHEHWSHGMVAPSRVVESLVRFLVQREAQHDIPVKFDASTVRRWFPDVDADLVI